MKISEIKLNENNPRYITDEKFEKLKKSIQDFPQMLELRPLVLDENNIVLGGNMRLRALQELGIEDVPIIYAKDLTEEQKKEFIIKDNVSYGNWDNDILANNWDNELLIDWGADIIKNNWNNLEFENEPERPNVNNKNTITIHIPIELMEEKNSIFEQIKNYVNNNFQGCEIE